MKIVIAGGSGLIGQYLSNKFIQKGDSVCILTRRATKSPHPNLNYVVWDARKLGTWIDELKDTDILINLSGKSINCRYTEKNKNLIISSRIQTVRVLGEALRKLETKPKLWLQASADAIYPPSLNKNYSEYESEIAGIEGDISKNWQFLVNVVRSWEGEFSYFQDLGVRQVLLRTSLFMSSSPKSVFYYLNTLSKVFLGGRAGSGLQKVSWIHAEDYYNAILHIINSQDLQGPVNLASPNNVSNQDLMKSLQNLNRRAFEIPAPEFMIKIGAFFLRTESDLILTSRSTYPKVLLDSGFKFKYNDWEEAAKNLISTIKTPKTSG